MKKSIALLLAFALIFALAACKNSADDDETTEGTTEETTAKPVGWVTNAEGEVQTTANTYILIDDNSVPITEILTDESGSEYSRYATTVVNEIATYPGTADIPTDAPGNTMASNHESWPENEFMKKVPVLAEEVDTVRTSKNDKGEVAVIYLNDMSYGDFLKYIDKCKAAGFEQTYGNNLPEEEEEGESYIYYSIANGLYLSVSYYTYSAPYRSCDVKMTIANYDVSGMHTN